MQSRTLGLWAIFLLFSGALNAAAVDSLQPRIEEVRISTDAMQRGVRGISAKFNLVIPQIEDEEMPVFVSEPGPYNLIASVYDDGGLGIRATEDAGEYSGVESICRDSLRFIVPQGRYEFRDLELFIPFFSMDLRSGLQHFRLRLEVFDSQTGQLLNDKLSDTLEFVKPPLKLLRFSLKRFVVDSTDPSGANWDFQLLNKDEIRPDLSWKLMRGRHVLFMPRKHKNTYEYEGTAVDLTPVFTLSEGDKLELFIEDFDLTSYPDQIGTMVVDPWDKDFQFATYQQKSVGSVNELVFAMFGFFLPELEVSNLKAKVGAQEDMVTGTRVSFHYEVEKRVGAGQFFLELFQTRGAQRIDPQFIRVTKGPVKLDEIGHLLLEAEKGDVELFVPHYGLPFEKGDIPAYLNLLADASIDEQRYTLLQRVQRLEDASNIELNDVRFSDFEVTETVQKGQTGLRINSIFHLPEYYRTDLPKTPFRVRPGMQTPFGQANPLDFEYTASAFWKTEGGEIILKILRDSVPLEFFIPYRDLPLEADEFALRTTFSVRSGYEENEILLGATMEEQNISRTVPAPITIQIPEVKSKKFSWLETDPNLQWRVFLGRDVVYESSVVYRNFEPTWRSEKANILAYPTDKIRIEVLHYSAGRAEHLLGVWKGSLADLVGESGKNALEPKMPGLKKCEILVTRR